MLALGPAKAPELLQRTRPEARTAQQGPPLQAQQQEQQVLLLLPPRTLQPEPSRGPGWEQQQPEGGQPPSQQPQHHNQLQLWQGHSFTQQGQQLQLQLPSQLHRQGGSNLQLRPSSPQLQELGPPSPQAQPRPRRQSQPYLKLPQLDEEEQALLRQLEEEIAGQPPNPTTACTAPVASSPRPWRNRGFTGSVSKAEPDKRRGLEGDALVVAASACSETATTALGASLGPGVQHRWLIQAGPMAASATDSKSLSAPGSLTGPRGSTLTAEEEDYLDLIMAAGKGGAT